MKTVLSEVYNMELANKKLKKHSCLQVLLNDWEFDSTNLYGDTLKYKYEL